MGQGYMTTGFGAFGKMPALGDFFRLDTPPGFVRVWDAWLQEAMVSSAQAGGALWDTQYMSAPIWRFALAPGLAGAAKIIGVLMPSVDRVGRRFPLALMAGVDGQGSVTADHLSADATYAALEDIALASLDDGMDREALNAALAGVQPHETPHAAPLRKAGNGLMLSNANADGIATELATGLIDARGFARPSLWSTVLEGSRRAMICDGMPNSHQARGLFDLDAPLWREARALT